MNSFHSRSLKIFERFSPGYTHQLPVHLVKNYWLQPYCSWGNILFFICKIFFFLIRPGASHTTHGWHLSSSCGRASSGSPHLHDGSVWSPLQDSWSMLSCSSLCSMFMAFSLLMMNYHYKTPRERLTILSWDWRNGNFPVYTWVHRYTKHIQYTEVVKISQQLSQQNKLGT